MDNAYGHIGLLEIGGKLGAIVLNDPQLSAAHFPNCDAELPHRSKQNAVLLVSV